MSFTAEVIFHKIIDNEINEMYNIQIHSLSLDILDSDIDSVILDNENEHVQCHGVVKFNNNRKSNK